MYKIIFYFELSFTGLCIKKCSDQIGWLLNGIKIISHLHSIQNKSGKRRRQVFVWRQPNAIKSTIWFGIQNKATSMGTSWLPSTAHILNRV